MLQSTFQFQNYISKLLDKTKLSNNTQFSQLLKLELNT
jgi:hypothetical protein